MAIKRESFIFAPMEGIADQAYRRILAKSTTGWDYIFTPFFRLPSSGKLQEDQIHKHIGNKIIDKTVLQVLTNKIAAKPDHFQLLNDLNIQWVDINMGCPSRKVNAHGGGAALLDMPSDMTKIISIARKNYKGFLSVKIRAGVTNSSMFVELLNIITNEGVNAIIVHPRTKIEHYSGVADRTLIKKAVDLTDIPIIGNGDITTPQDVTNMYEQTNCHSVMIGRGAIWNPWIPEQYLSGIFNLEHINKYRLKKLSLFLNKLIELNELPRLKQLTHYLFKDHILKANLLKCKTVQEYMILVTKYI